MKENTFFKNLPRKVGQWTITGLLVAGYWVAASCALFWSTFIIGSLSSERFGRIGLLYACGLVVFGGVLAMLHIFSCRHFQNKVGRFLYDGFGLCWDLMITWTLLTYRDRFPFEAWMIALIWGLRVAFRLPVVRRCFSRKKDS